MSESPQTVSLPVVWVGVDEQPVLSANEFVGQVHGREIYLTLGIVTPPIFTGLNGEVDRLSQTYVPARPIARVALTKPRLDELVDVLRQMQQMYERDHPSENGGGQ